MVGALVLALLSAALVLRSEARAAGAERRWGELTAVVVARADLRAGSDLGSGQVRVRRLPTATLASDALTEAAWNDLSQAGDTPVIDRSVAEGEPIRSGILVGDGAPGAGAGSVVAFPAGTLAPRLEPGDRVRVVAGASLARETPGGESESFPTSSTASGVVVGPPAASADTESTDPTGPPGWVAWVAVSPRDADEVARIALSGSVALVLDRPDLNDSGLNDSNLGGADLSPP